MHQENCQFCVTEFDRKYLPIKWKSIRDAWVKLRKDEKDTPEELNFLIQHVKKTSRFSDASQKSSASYSREEAKDMFESNNPDVEEIEESTVDFETMQKKEQWLKRTKSLKEKEEELQILKKIRLANEIKNNPDNLRQIDTNFSRKPKKSNFFATLENRLNNIVEDQALDETDENWCELIVKLILSVEESKQLQVFNAIMLKSEEFQSKK